MKTANTHTSIRKLRAVILLGTLAAVMTTVACSSNARPAVNSSAPVSPRLRPAALETVVPPVSHVAQVVTTPEKPSRSKLIAYRSRDYAVSFLYSRQYGFFSARAVANADPSLRPKSDGHDGQFTLVRIEIPKGFYPGSNYESGYFTLSLNQNLDEQECESALRPGNDGRVKTETINGADFRWIERDGGGRGNAAKLRNYVTFTNGTCYELEMGVKTKNKDGMAKEVDPDQVLRRLDAILRTVTILPATENPAAPQVESSTAAPVAD